MNIIKSNWLSNILIFAAGIALCCLYNGSNTLDIIIYLLGAVFTATGCVNIISATVRHSKGNTGSLATVIAWLAGLGGIGLGAAMLITPSSFHNTLVYVFAALLILGALWHYLCLAYFYKGNHIPNWLYILPTLILAAGIVLFCSEGVRSNRPAAILITGIGAIVFAVTTFFEYVSIKTHAKDVAAEEEKEAASAPNNDTSKPSKLVNAITEPDDDDIQHPTPTPKANGGTTFE